MWLRTKRKHAMPGRCSCLSKTITLFHMSSHLCLQSMSHVSFRAFGLKKNPVDNPCILMPQYRSVSVFSLCIGLQCFGSSGSKVATFPYKCSRRSTLCQLPAPAGNRNFQYKCSTQSAFWQLQLESSNFSVVCAGHFGSSGSKVAACQCKQV